MTQRILFINVGMNPRLITNAIWGLVNHLGWTPSRVHIFTTASGKPAVEELLTLYDNGEGPLERLHWALNLRHPIKYGKVHVPSYRKNGETITEIDRVNSTIERDLLAKAYDEELKKYMDAIDTEVYCLAKGGLDQMTLLLGLSFILQLRSGKDAWFSLEIEPTEWGQALERDPDFWFPEQETINVRRERRTGTKVYQEEATLNREDIRVRCDLQDYTGVRDLIKDRLNFFTLNNFGELRKLRLNAAGGALTCVGTFEIDVELDDAKLNTLLLFVLANVLRLRHEPWTRPRNDEVIDCFLEWRKRALEEGGTLPVHDVGNDRKAVRDELEVAVREKVIRPLIENEPTGRSMVIDDEELEEALATYFGGGNPEDCDRWWTRHAMAQWHHERSAIAQSRRPRNVAPGITASRAEVQAGKAEDKIWKRIENHILCLQKFSPSDVTRISDAIGERGLPRDLLINTGGQNNPNFLTQLRREQIEFIGDPTVLRAILDRLKDLDRYDRDKIEAFAASLDE